MRYYFVSKKIMIAFNPLRKQAKTARLLAQWYYINRKTIIDYPTVHR